MRADVKMKLSTYVYPPIPHITQIGFDIKYNETLPILYQEKVFYKGQLQHSEYGIRDNAGKEFAGDVVECMNSIKWFVDLIEATSLPLETIIYRFCTSDAFREIVLSNSTISDEDRMEKVHEGIDQYFNHIRYNSGRSLLNYVQQHEIDQIQHEVERLIIIVLTDKLESTE